MFTYEQAKAFLIEHLRQDAHHHRAGWSGLIGEYFDEFDANLPRATGPEFEKLHIAINFWDYWHPARNHDWQYYPKIKQEDWPRLAESIVSDVSADRGIQDPLILSEFGLKKK